MSITFKIKFDYEDIAICWYCDCKIVELADHVFVKVRDNNGYIKNISPTHKSCRGKYP